MVVPVVVASETVTCGGWTELRELTGARYCKRLLLLLTSPGTMGGVAREKGTFGDDGEVPRWSELMACYQLLEEREN